MATLTINFSAAAATRLQNALRESVMDLEDPVTIDDLKNYVISDLKQLVRSSEKRVAARAATSGEDVDIT